MLISNFVLHEEDIHQFADDSGDWNPIHIDKNLSRRYSTGTTISHGIFILMLILDLYLEKKKVNLISLNCSFKKPVVSKKEYRLELNQISDNIDNLYLYNNRDLHVMIQVVFNFRNKILDSFISDYPIPQKKSPQNIRFNDLSGASGSLEIIGNVKSLKKKFKNSFSNLNENSLLAIVNTSRLVGMVIPGLNSIYSSLKVKFLDKILDNKLEWDVDNVFTPKLPFNINFSGSGITGKIQTFYRSSPVEQPSIKNLIKHSVNNRKIKKNILVIGGSRGIGEVVSKILALEGGNIIITYNLGLDDAKKVVNEIKTSGNNGSCVHLNVLKKETINNVLNNIASLDEVYYFASPRIIESSSQIFDLNLFNKYNEYYIEAFIYIIKFLSKRFSNQITIFYPSTIFLDEKNHSSFEEYKLVKLIGENISNIINNKSDQLKVIYERIPILLTDQTSGNLKILQNEIGKSVSKFLNLIN
tara:strand:- start:2027 stop:3439 length:1413 start_codon:yes stop_codon:yes gene_type:complete